MTVLRMLLAVFFVLAGLGGIVSAVRRGNLVDLVGAVLLFAVGAALWPGRDRSRL
ncbi:hypothetical protein EV137_3763 [Kribbella pratensis]|uniref:Uncharacterized protein n=1 Tax=Kribbella pratensis TaxID=2512112 RepID=A0ABY2FF07_9ACTN|nr:hypothetical protein [Kribbella pratensis]TDW89958.1 hypothetical protein EV137_3763 [Kribbella pratensis]